MSIKIQRLEKLIIWREKNKMFNEIEKKIFIKTIY